MSYQDLTAEQRVQKATLDVMTHTKYRSLAGVLMMGVTKVDEDFPTAYTDGVNKTYGRKFVMGLAEPELRFTILHEALHVALRHLITWLHLWKENPKLANLSCDLVINLLLVDSDAGEGFLQIPKIAALDRKYVGMDSGEVFRLLKEQGGNEPGFDEHGWGEAQGMTPDEVKAVEAEVASALQQGSVLVGKMGGELGRAVGEITKPKVDWVEETREFVLNICSGRELSTWKRPSRRSIDSGEYMPSSYSESIGRIVVGPDTSGSIGGAIMSRFISEVAGIGKLVTPELMDLLYWDARVAAHEKYGPGQYEMMAASTKPKGGGGTAPSCVTKYMKEKKIVPECAIMLTDGHVGNDWGGQWPCPVLWVIVGNKRATAKTGRTIHV